MSVIFNDTLCEGLAESQPCFQSPDSWVRSSPVRNVGLLVAANASDTFRVVMAASTRFRRTPIALVVPAYIDPQAQFGAASFSSRAQCTSLNPLCRTSNQTGVRTVTSCDNIGLPQIPYPSSAQSALNVIHPILNGTIYEETDSLSLTWSVHNPFDLVVQLRWPMFALDASIESPNTAVDRNSQNSTMSLYARCELMFTNVTYVSLDGVLSISHEQLVPSHLSNIFWGPLINQVANSRLASDLEATAQAETNADNVIALLSQDLSRLSIGMISGAFISSSVSVQLYDTARTLGQYDAVPVLALVVVRASLLNMTFNLKFAFHRFCTSTPCLPCTSAWSLCSPVPRPSEHELSAQTAKIPPSRSSTLRTRGSRVRSL